MPVLAKKIIFSYKAHFDLGGYVNKQNWRIWGTENPHAYIEKPSHPKRVTVWCGFWSRCIIGPFFYENEQEEAVTVNGDRYRAMLNEFLRRRNRTVLRATQPKLHSMFCALFWRSHYQPQSSRQCVGLLDQKPEFESQARHQNEVQKVFFRRFPLSRFLAFYYESK